MKDILKSPVMLMFAFFIIGIVLINSEIIKNEQKNDQCLYTDHSVIYQK